MAVRTQRSITSRDAAAETDIFEIEAVYVHPTYKNEIGGIDSTNIERRQGFAPYPLDIALIKLASETPHIPVAPLNAEALPIGSKVIIAGYGCETGTSSADKMDVRKLKLGESTVLEANALNHPGREHNLGDPVDLARRYWITSDRFLSQSFVSSWFYCCRRSGKRIHEDNQRHKFGYRSMSS